MAEIAFPVACIGKVSAVPVVASPITSEKTKDAGPRMPATDKTTLTLELAYITAHDECLDHSKVFVGPASATTASSRCRAAPFGQAPHGPLAF